MPALLALCAAAAGLVVVARTYLVRRFQFASARDDTSVGTKVLLFHGTELVDANAAAEELLARASTEGSDWARLLAVLSPHFPHLSSQLSTLDDRGTVELHSSDGEERLIASVIGDRIRITLTSAEGANGQIQIDPLAFRSTLQELETLRSATNALPFPIWRQTRQGELIWGNRAYLTSARSGETGAGAEKWPPPDLFDVGALREITTGDGCSRRLQPARGPVAERHEWYECSVSEISGDLLYAAVGIDATVEAESQLRDIMQTLTRTFSDLTTGLAIFDRQRRMAMFNPALTDLTGLPADFLAARPTLFSFLDRLRDRRMIPEPRDYGSWRRRIAELESAALGGTYCETWSLPNNRTYRITGRPHHGGAVAFIFEDISDEIALTRRFRSELELGQAVIDAMEDAIAVFLPSGDLSMVNLAYQEFWGTDVGDTVDTPTVTEMSRLWMARAASPAWGEIRDFVLHSRDRAAWEDTVMLGGGGSLACRVAPLPGGSTLVSLRFNRRESEVLASNG